MRWKQELNWDIKWLGSRLSVRLVYDVSWVSHEGQILWLKISVFWKDSSLSEECLWADSRSALSSGSTCLPGLICGPAPVWTLCSGLDMFWISWTPAKDWSLVRQTRPELSENIRYSISEGTFIISPSYPSATFIMRQTSNIQYIIRLCLWITWL